MIQSVSAPRSPSVTTAGRGASLLLVHQASRFALSLAAVSTGGGDADALPTEDAVPVMDGKGRQDDADDGTDLPDDGSPTDPRLAWLTMPVVVPPVPSDPPPPVVATAGGVRALPAVAATPLAATAAAPIGHRTIVPAGAAAADAAAAMMAASPPATIDADTVTDTPLPAPPAANPTVALFGPTPASTLPAIPIAAALPPATTDADAAPDTPLPVPVAADQVVATPVPILVSGQPALPATLVAAVPSITPPAIPIVSPPDPRTLVAAFATRSSTPRSVTAPIAAQPIAQAAPIAQPVPVPATVATLVDAPNPMPMTPSAIAVLPDPATGVVLPVVPDAMPVAAMPGVPFSAAPLAAPPGASPGPLPVALPDPGRPPAPTPALQAFAGAMRAGWKQDAHPGTRDDDPLAAPNPTTLAPMEAVRHAVAAAAPTQEQTLDTRREHWPATMIDHIEALRDAADATSSKIRVVPDALGTIDLSVKREGDTLHVHFAAEQAATRTLLADAQPRLAEIAQSRGLRLGDADIGSGGGGQSAPQQQVPIPVQSATPIPAPARATIAAVADDDIRIA